jgi:Transposase DDE domain group 1
MANPAGETTDGALKLDFDRRLMLQFRGSVVTSDAGLLAYRELDDALGLSAVAAETLADARTGKNGRHALVGLLRQSLFGRLAGYEDVNDAERLRHDPAMRWIIGGKAAQGALRPRRARWAASRHAGSRRKGTFARSVIFPVAGSTLCTAAARREASCSTWIRA